MVDDCLYLLLSVFLAVEFVLEEALHLEAAGGGLHARIGSVTVVVDAVRRADTVWLVVRRRQG